MATTTTNTSFLDRKIDICFAHGDQNNDGVLELADALSVAARVIIYIGEPFTSPKAAALLAAYDTFWKHVSQNMDTDRDSKITPLEWRQGLTAFAQDPARFAEGFRPLGEALFAICDKDNDGKVSRAEFAAWQKAFGTPPGNIQAAFEKLDRDHSGYLSVDELLTAFNEFYTSNDPDALGNWLYGNLFGN